MLLTGDMIMATREVVGHFLRSKRIEKGLLIKDIACLQLPVNDINDIESGNMYNIDALIKYLHVTGLTLNFLSNELYSENAIDDIFEKTYEVKD